MAFESFPIPTETIDLPKVAVDADRADAAAAIAETAAANAQSSALTCATWDVLLGLTGTANGMGAEVLDSDFGTHLAASATGYDGAVVNNAGRYSWNATWSRFMRIGDTGLAGKVDKDVLAENLEVVLADRSGILAALRSSTGLMPWHVLKSTGEFFANGIPVARTLREKADGIVRPEDRSGILWGVETPSGATPIFVDKFSGEFYANGKPVAPYLTRLQEQIDALSEAQSLPDFPSDDISAWGDSITANSSTDGWIYKLSQLTGRDVYNGGIGGQGSRQIAARANAVPVRFDAFTLPADTSAVSVTISPSGYSPCSLNQTQSVVILGVECALFRDGNGDHTVTRYAAGAEVSVPQGTPGYSVFGETFRDRSLIIGTGRNSFKNGSADYMSAAQIAATIRAMIDHQNARTKRAIVWDIFPWEGEEYGATNRTQLDEYNDSLAAAFPEYWLAMGEWLRTTSPERQGGTWVDDPFTASGTTPDSQDLADIANGLTPTQFRSDAGHPNAVGMTAMAYRFYMEMQLKGWL